jgi:hypothetical protein
VHSMRVVLKNLMRRNPAIFNPLWSFRYPLIYRRDGKYFGSEYLNGQQACLTIFEENGWGSSESRSGRGSTVAYAKRLRPLVERYEGYSFQTIDIVEGPLPNADLWLCRDVFFQLPSQDIQQVMLPPPLSMVPDFVVPEPPRYLGLWSRERVAAVQSNSSLSSSL